MGKSNYFIAVFFAILVTATLLDGRAIAQDNAIQSFPFPTERFAISGDGTLVATRESNGVRVSTLSRGTLNQIAMLEGFHIPGVREWQRNPRGTQALKATPPIGPQPFDPRFPSLLLLREGQHVSVTLDGTVIERIIAPQRGLLRRGPLGKLITGAEAVSRWNPVDYGYEGDEPNSSSINALRFNRDEEIVTHCRIANGFYRSHSDGRPFAERALTYSVTPEGIRILTVLFGDVLLVRAPGNPLNPQASVISRYSLSASVPEEDERWFRSRQITTLYPPKYNCVRSFTAASISPSGRSLLVIVRTVRNEGRARQARVDVYVTPVDLSSGLGFRIYKSEFFRDPVGEYGGRWVGAQFTPNGGGVIVSEGSSSVSIGPSSWPAYQGDATSRFIIQNPQEPEIWNDEAERASALSSEDCARVGLLDDRIPGAPMAARCERERDLERTLASVDGLSLFLSAEKYAKNGDYEAALEVLSYIRQIATDGNLLPLFQEASRQIDELLGRPPVTLSR
ncbi:hypothetical protein [Litoreibacter roseus]|nr:hypothetical protein [Litoreibacter roseus]